MLHSSARDVPRRESWLSMVSRAAIYFDDRFMTNRHRCAAML
jgi:hypothetical protein